MVWDLSMERGLVLVKKFDIRMIVRGLEVRPKE